MFVFQFGAVASQGGEEVSGPRRSQLILFIGERGGRSTSQRNRQRGAGIGGRYHQQRKKGRRTKQVGHINHWKLRTLASKQAKGRAGGDGIGGRERRTGKGSSWSYLTKDEGFEVMLAKIKT